MNICICTSVRTWKGKTIFWVYMRENFFSHSHPFCWIILKAFAIFQTFQEQTDLTITFPLKSWKRNLLYPALFKFNLYCIQFALLHQAQAHQDSHPIGGTQACASSVSTGLTMQISPFFIPFFHDFLKADMLSV